MIRRAAVAGRFYPSDPDQLKSQIREFAPADSQKVSAIGCIVPHAGYVYSGKVAGAVYSGLDLPARFILLGPRHYPQGERLAILSEGSWATPLGEARLDGMLAAELKKLFPALREDSIAHGPEHSLEVQLPFLIQLAGDFTFVPVLIAAERFEVLQALGHALARAINGQEAPVMMVASSDMNHRENDATTRVKDRKAIDTILSLDPRALYDTVRRENISMCGYGPAITMLTAARDLGATVADLVRYATSAEATGEYDDVVGYAGIIVQ